MGNKRALLFGASGFVGGYLLTELLANPTYSEVIVVVRKPLGIQHPKLREYIGDLNTIRSLQTQLVADHVFCTLGTTKKKTPDKTLYYQIDHDYPVAAAQIGKENGASAFFLVSSVGADPSSSTFYLKTKGEAERDIIALAYDATHIFRPSGLTGDRKESRIIEKVAGKILKVINGLLLGSMKKYRPIDGKEVAQAINQAASQVNPKGVHYYYWNEIKSLL